MASTVPAESQSIHNFDLSHLKWSADGDSSGEQSRNRCAKSSSRSLDESSASLLRQSPFRDSALETQPLLQSPVQDSIAAAGEASVHVDCLMRESPIRGESSKPSSPIRECMKQSMIGGESVSPSFLAGESVGLFPTTGLKIEPEDLNKDKNALIQRRRNHSTNSALDSKKNRDNSSTSEQPSEKFEKKSKEAEADVSESKRSKILIKFPCKNNEEEENPQDESLKIRHNNEHGENKTAQDGGKSNNNSIPEETKTWNLRPRRKPYNATFRAKTANYSGMPEKSKAVPLMSANISGQRDGKCDGSGEKKEKRKLSLSVSLSKEQIEEDIVAMTGSKPARRPKKRAKHLKKQLDSVFPGLWLVSITPDSYKS